MLPSDALEAGDFDGPADTDFEQEGEGKEVMHAEGQFDVAAPPVERKLSLQELREAVKKIRIRSSTRRFCSRT